MSFAITSSNIYEVLDTKDANIASIKDMAKANATAPKIVETKTQTLAEKNGRMFSAVEVIEYEQRQAKRAAAKAAQEARAVVNAAKPEPVKKSKRNGRKGAKVYTKEETAASLVRQATKAEQAAYLDRKAHRAVMAAEREACEARVLRRADKAAYVEREANRQAKNKRNWMSQCLRRKWCYNCGSDEHKSNDCLEPLYEGKYNPVYRYAEED